MSQVKGAPGKTGTIMFFSLPKVLKNISNTILSITFETFISLQDMFILMGSVDDLNVEKLEKAANIMKAIAHPVRIAILKHLEGGRKLSVTELYELLGIEQSTASHHLGILKDKGILCSRRDGKNSYYYLKHEILSQIVDCVNRCACDQLK